MQTILDTLCIIFIYLQEVETSEKNAFTKRIDGVKNKMTKARSDLRVKVGSQFTISVASSNFSAQVGLPALQSEEKFPSDGSLLPPNGIKYCSEPELKSADEARVPERSGSRACSEGPECEGYVNIERGPGGQS